VGWLGWGVVLARPPSPSPRCRWQARPGGVRRGVQQAREGAAHEAVSSRKALGFNDSTPSWLGCAPPRTDPTAARARPQAVHFATARCALQSANLPPPIPACNATNYYEH
jgi:hypothetical protein